MAFACSAAPLWQLAQAFSRPAWWLFVKSFEKTASWQVKQVFVSRGAAFVSAAFVSTDNAAAWARTCGWVKRPAAIERPPQRISRPIRVGRIFTPLPWFPGCDSLGAPVAVGQ